MINDSTPQPQTAGALTVSAWLGGPDAIRRLTEVFYRRVKADDLLGPVFAHMSAEHPAWVAQWLAEVFGGPETYTAERGGYPHMIDQHRDKALTEEQRARWVALMTAAADEADLPADPETRSTFVAYIEWGSRIALANSQPGAAPAEHLPVPRWGWGQGGLPGSALGSPVEQPAAAPATTAAAGGPSEVPEAPGFGADIAGLFTDRDRSSMSWAFDLASYEDVRTHADAILEQVAAGRMPCYGAWPQHSVDTLRRWVETGTAP